jgi:drug/metabolite transporter (DMT)-like permease
VKNGDGRYPILLSLMTLLFGFSFIATKQALSGLGIFQVVFSRHFLALLLLTFLLWKDRRKFYIAGKDLKHFLALTMVEPVGYFIFETFGLRYTSPSSVSILIATIPVFTLIFAWWILREKTHRLALLGIALSLVGVYLVVSVQKIGNLAPRPLLGNSLAIGAAMSAGLYNVLCRRLSRTYSPWTITYYQAIVASVVFLPLAVGELFWEKTLFINGEIIASIVYLAFGSSVVAYILLNFSLSRLPAYKVAIFSNLIPVVTIFASWILYGERMASERIAGAVLVIFGIYLTFYRGRNT